MGKMSLDGMTLSGLYEIHDVFPRQRVGQGEMIERES